MNDRSARVLGIVALAVAVLWPAVLAVILAMDKAETAAKPATADTSGGAVSLRVREIQIVDDSGRVRGSFGVDSDGRVALDLYDEDGPGRAALALAPAERRGKPASRAALILTERAGRGDLRLAEGRLERWGGLWSIGFKGREIILDPRSSSVGSPELTSRDASGNRVPWRDNLGE